MGLGYQKHQPCDLEGRGFESAQPPGRGRGMEIEFNHVTNVTKSQLCLSTETPTKTLDTTAQ